jgi:hypothetical protein
VPSQEVGRLDEGPAGGGEPGTGPVDGVGRAEREGDPRPAAPSVVGPVPGARRRLDQLEPDAAEVEKDRPLAAGWLLYGGEASAPSRWAWKARSRSSSAV